MSLPDFSVTPLHRLYMDYGDGRITWEEYIDNLLVFSIKSHNDPSGRDLRNLQWAAPSGYIVVSWCKKICPVKDNEPSRRCSKPIARMCKGPDIMAQ